MNKFLEKYNLLKSTQGEINLNSPMSMKEIELTIKRPIWFHW